MGEGAEQVWATVPRHEVLADMRNPEPHIQAILDGFDFVKTQRVMAFLGRLNVNGTPLSIAELKIIAQELLHTAAAFKKGGYASTFGLAATNHGQYLSLEFVATGFDSEYLTHKMVNPKLIKI